MTINTIAIQSPGDMGHEIGRVLVSGGYKVVSALEGRSKRTRDLAKSGGIIDVGNLENLYDDVDVILSIMRPDEALRFVNKMCDLASFHKARPLLVDLNAVAPSTALKAEKLSRVAGLDFLDGGIIGEPPRAPERRPEGSQNVLKAIFGCKKVFFQIVLRVGGPRGKSPIDPTSTRGGSKRRNKQFRKSERESMESGKRQRNDKP